MSRLAEFVWYDPPASTESNLRTHIATLRRALDAAEPGLGARLETARSQGFRLRAQDREVDSHLFVQCAAQGNHELRASRPHQAAVALTEGMALWRGRVGDGLPDTVPFRERFAELDRIRWQARADLCEARLRLCEGPLIVNDLYELSAESPLSERPVALLMEALFSAGDPAHALTQYHRYRRALAEETGTEPGLELQAFYRQILRRSERPRATGDGRPPPSGILSAAAG